MADFSFLSDTDDSAVDQILAEAMDDCVLKQIAAINCSSFSDSVLPSHLESRFQRLKTFPSSSSKPQTLVHSQSQNPISGDDPNNVSEKGRCFEGKSRSNYASTLSDSSSSSVENVGSPKLKEKSGDCKVKEGKSRSNHVSSPSNSSSSSFGNVGSPKLKGKTGDCKFKEGKSRSGSFSYRSETVESGCFWCSPKRVSRKKSGKRDLVAELGVDLGKHDELLSDLKSFSPKEQKKLMKLAMKEEEKINREAEKIVKWAKQTSARLDFSVSDDELSDDDSGHNFGHH